LALSAVAMLLQGGEKQSNGAEATVTIQPVSDAELGYNFLHLRIVADGRVPSEGTDYGYRVLSVSDEGDCVEGCPASILYVVLGDASQHRDEAKLKVYRIDGARFVHFPSATTLNPKENGGFFLELRFTSMPHPGQPQHYVARIGPHGAVVERDGPDVPPAAHHFGQLFQRPDASVFRIKLKDGNVFRLQEFEVFDPAIYGQPDAWSATVVESGAGNSQGYRMNSGTHFGAFLERDIMEIFDEGLNKVVYQREGDDKPSP
jgi:hypothetical protein